MPKRKHNEEGDVAKKLRKIERMLKKCKRRRKRIISTSSEGSSQPTHNQNGEENQNFSRDNAEVDSILLADEHHQGEDLAMPSPLLPVSPPPALSGLVPSSSQEDQPKPQDDAIQSSDGLLEESQLDNDILEILGDDPTEKVKYGKDIRPELASRFNHIATNGLSKEIRKDMCEKYLLPENCMMIGAPALNAEVKAALNETVLKRDKLIEYRQKRMGAAISCLGETLSHALEAKQKDNEQIKRLMDASRLICDAQHNESVSRRNLAVYSLKKEMKEPLINTKIDKSLFGDNLIEALKAAKAVSKSGTDLKTQTKPSKNWKPPVAGRRQPATSRRNAPAAPTTTPAQPPPPAPPAEPRIARAPSSRRPPPPPPRSARRRY